MPRSFCALRFKAGGLLARGGLSGKFLLSKRFLPRSFCPVCLLSSSFDASCFSLGRSLTRCLGAQCFLPRGFGALRVNAGRLLAGGGLSD